MAVEPASFDLILSLNRCSNTYGQAPCTATGAVGMECYNCFATCQDTPNYSRTTETLRLSADRETPPDAAELGYPCLTRNPAMTSAEIRRGEGLAVRGGCTAYARDFVATDTPPIGLDPYWATRSVTGQGTFFPRLRALYPYLQGSTVLLEYYTWAAGGTRTITSVREYLLNTIEGPDSSGNVTIKTGDLLAQLAGLSTSVPRVDNANLLIAINPNVTSIDITEAATTVWPAADGEFVVEDEIITYLLFDGATATGCVRGAYNTNNVSHAAGDRCQTVQTYYGWNVVDVLYDLLVRYGGVPARHIPYSNDPQNPDEWDIEKERYLAGHTINHAIGEPETVEKAVKDLLSQCYLHMWYEPTTAKIRLAATNVRLAEYQARYITEQNDILADSVRVTEKRVGTVTQAWTYFDKYRYTDADEPQNYGSVFISINSEIEAPDAWGQRRVVAQLANWLNGAGNIAITTNGRTLTENTAPRYEITFQTDITAGVQLGEFVVMRVFAIQRADGTLEDLSCQVVKAKETIPGVRMEYTATILRAVDPNYTPRFAKVVDVANESVEYGDATQEARDSWGWISNIDGFANGDDSYVIL